jgi:hypothetical protein
MSIPIALFTSAALKHFGALPPASEGEGALDAVPEATYCES